MWAKPEKLQSNGLSYFPTWLMLVTLTCKYKLLRFSFKPLLTNLPVIPFSLQSYQKKERLKPANPSNQCILTTSSTYKNLFHFSQGFPFAHFSTTSYVSSSNSRFKILPQFWGYLAESENRHDFELHAIELKISLYRMLQCTPFFPCVPEHEASHIQNQRSNSH
jgi:hypothetical protein